MDANGCTIGFIYGPNQWDANQLQSESWADMVEVGLHLALDSA